VPEHQRLAQPEVTDPAVSPVVQVGAADPAVADPDGGLTGPGLRLGQLVDPQVTAP
jgi:hypothetical protein